MPLPSTPEPELFVHQADRFFDRKEVADSIDDLASSSNLVVFVGAGLTVDMTGITWGSLVRAILKDPRSVHPNAISDAAIRTILETLSPLSAATVAAHYVYRFTTKDSDRKRSLHRAIVGQLYPGSVWQSGMLMRSTLELCLQRCLHGLKTTIVTTNYDTHIESSYDKARKEVLGSLNPTKPTKTFPGLRARIGEKTREIRQPTGRGSWLELEYLHGRIDPRGVADGDIVFSEVQYALKAGTVTRRLERLFRDADLLMIGTSLTDPPVLNALSNTRPQVPSAGGKRESVRVALTPVASMVGDDPSAPLAKEATEAIIDASAARMQELGVVPLCPDFYFQVPQFLEELRGRTATHRVLPGYNERLDQWLEGWWDFGKLQSPDGDDLDLGDAAGFEWTVEMFNRLRLGISEIKACQHAKQTNLGSEAFKLELWVRTPGHGEEGRNLRLVASSNSVVFEDTNPRLVTLTLGSDYAAVQAFVRGSPYLRDLTSEDGAHSDSAIDPTGVRWRSILAVPILGPIYRRDAVDSDDESHLRLPRGVIVLVASGQLRNGRWQSSVSTMHPSFLKDCVEVMIGFGSDLLALPKLKYAP